MIKRVVVLLILVVSISLVQGQNIYDMPKVIPPSPTAGAFARYTETPVDISTGVPQIEIPLYTITSRKLSVPLSLSYHAGGIKVNDISTAVGLGWVLKGMGLVSRTVLDRPDEEVPQFGSYIGGKATYTSELSYQNALNALANTWASHEVLGEALYNDLKYHDKQADRFTYELPGTGGGTFRYDFNTGNCIIMPYKPIIISKVINPYSNSGEITSFGIVDESGIKYQFTQAFKSEQTNSCQTCYNGTANTSWYITSIISADGSDEIDYQYGTVTNDYNLGYFTHSVSVNGLERDPATGFYVPQVMNSAPYNAPPENYQSSNFITTHEPLLQKITSATTVVTFEYTSDRADWTSAPYRLSAIKVWDKMNNLIKEIDLNNNVYFGSNNAVFMVPNGNGASEQASNLRLKLNGVTVKGNDGTAIENYSFIYNDCYFPPYNTYSRYIGRSPMYFDEDYWGYYNGAGNAGLIPNEYSCIPSGLGYPTWGGSRRPNPNVANSCMLQKIIYPTGGNTRFEFEPNSANSVYENSIGADNVGGFRVKTITSTDNSSSSDIVKSFTYQPGTVSHYISSDLFNSSLAYGTDFDDCNSVQGWPSLNPMRPTTQSSSFCSLSFSNGASVIYTNVTEYNGTSGTANDIGKTEYNYSLPKEFPTSMGSIPDPWTNIYGAYWYDNGSYSPQLLTKKVYKNENGNYTPVSEVDNTYQFFHDGDYSTGVNAMITSYFYDIGTGRPLDFPYLIGQSCPNSGLNRFPYYFSYVDTRASERISLLTNSTEKYFDKNGNASLSTSKDYIYGNFGHLFPTQITTNSSKGDQLISTYQYPLDNNSDAFAYSLQQQHILTPLIEQRNYKNSIFLNAVKTNYQIIPSTNLIVPANIVTTVGSFQPDTRLSYNSYDNYGNLTDVSKPNDARHSYLWGYNKTYPVAEVVGADYSTISQYADAGILDNPTDDNQMRNTLNNVRSSLAGSNAQVTTFTYKPLVGMTSKTDPAGRTTYYEYDNSNRLKLIRDQDNNILKKFCYNYAGQTTSCLETSGSGAGSGSNTPVTIYAKLYYENINFGWDEVDADIVVRFYSDAACTLPYDVSNLTVNYSINFGCNGYGIYNASAVADGNTLIIGEFNAIQYLYTDCSNYWLPCQSYSCNVDWSLTSGNYVIVQ